MNKQIAKQTMLSLEARDLESANEKYQAYFASTRLDRSEPIEDDEQAQAELASGTLGKPLTTPSTRILTRSRNSLTVLAL
jgi:hypothetical protein